MSASKNNSSQLVGARRRNMVENVYMVKILPFIQSKASPLLLQVRGPFGNGLWLEQSLMNSFSAPPQIQLLLCKKSEIGIVSEKEGRIEELGKATNNQLQENSFVVPNWL